MQFVTEHSILFCTIVWRFFLLPVRLARWKPWYFDSITSLQQFPNKPIYICIVPVPVLFFFIWLNFILIAQSMCDITITRRLSNRIHTVPNIDSWCHCIWNIYTMCARWRDLNETNNKWINTPALRVIATRINLYAMNKLFGRSQPEFLYIQNKNCQMAARFEDWTQYRWPAHLLFAARYHRRHCFCGTFRGLNSTIRIQ